MRRATRNLLPGLLAALLVPAAACSDDDASITQPDTDSGVDAGGAGADAGPDVEMDTGIDAEPDAEQDAAADAKLDADAGDVVEWLPCVLDVNHPSGPLVECAMVEAPLRYGDPDGPKIDLWVQRVPARVTPKRGQIWFLQGGPGGSGTVFGGMFADLAELAPEWDLLTTDHRGVGYSTRLGCSAQEASGSEGGFQVTEAEWPACLQDVQSTWGDDLAEFTTTAAAHDIGLLVERTREPGADVHLFGVSYGTYWLIRYLQLYPDQVDGVILDSIAPPGISFADYDLFMNDVGMDFLEACAADALCSSRLGTDTGTVAEQVFDDFAHGSCPGASDLLDPGSERLYLRWALGTLLMSEALREAVPAVLYRLNRCEADDVAALERLLSRLWTQSKYPSPVALLDSDVLGVNVGISELWPDPHPDPTALDEQQEALLFSIGLSPRFAGYQDMWPAYPRDQYVDAWPTTDVPILMGNGGLDPQTPPWVAEPARTHFTAAHQYYFDFPGCAHGLISQSTVSTPDTPDCFLQMLLDFVDDPTTVPDDSCLSDLRPLDFGGSHPYSQYLFGTDDLWDDAASPTSLNAHTLQGPPPGFERNLRWLQDRVPAPRFLRERSR